MVVSGVIDYFSECYLILPRLGSRHSNGWITFPIYRLDRHFIVINRKRMSAVRQSLQLLGDIPQSELTVVPQMGTVWRRFIIDFFLKVIQSC